MKSHIYCRFDGAGAVAQNYTYDSFGNIIATTGSLVNSFRYTGREWDTETSLYYYRARYYDVAIGRFLSEDPIGFKGGVDFYAYVGSNPTNRIDPLGLLQLCCRPARSVTWTGAAACHCFLKLSDGTTLGAYFKLSTYLMLEKKADYGDDKNPQDKPTCKDIPGSDCKVRQAFDALPQYQFYGLNGSSNSIPQRTLAGAGIAVEMPSCAWGAIPFNPGTFSGNRFGYVPWFR